MKNNKLLFIFLILILVIIMLNSCEFSSTSKEPFEIGGDINNAKIILIGETHAIDWILDVQIEKWRHFYVNEGLRNLFIEVGYFAGQLKNQWMKSDNDDILDLMFEDLRGTLAFNPVVKEFYRIIKREFPETIFHGVDVGHQYWSTGERFLNYLIDNGLEGTEQYILTQKAIEQGKYFYETRSLEYRVNIMASNFIREFDNIGNIKIMGIFGSDHTNFNRNISDNIPTMARMLRNHYGDIIYFVNYRN
jgi:hypothetical protein